MTNVRYKCIENHQAYFYHLMIYLKNQYNKYFKVIIMINFLYTSAVTFFSNVILACFAMLCYAFMGQQLFNTKSIFIHINNSNSNYSV